MLLLSVPVVLWLSEPWLVDMATLLNSGLLAVYFGKLVDEEAVESFMTNRQQVSSGTVT